MDRQTRKANLKKLQLPATSGYKQRKTRQTTIPSTATDTAITNYFLTPEKHNIQEEMANGINKLSPTITDVKQKAQRPDSDISPGMRTRAKRTKLDAFLFKDPKNIPNSIKNPEKYPNDDLILPEKKAKRAPKSSQAKSSKLSRAKRQTTIKSAFLRNEQLFAEIAAQHCAADQFDGDEVQLALAVSQSEAECKGIKTIDGNVIDDGNILVNGDNEAESIREKLKKYGFRTAEKEDYNTFAAAFIPKTYNRKLKSKWANKFTALTLRSTENQMKKLQENIEKLLNSKFRSKPLSDHENIVPHYELQSSLLKKSRVHENKRILQNVDNVNQSNELFFVKDLFEINQLPAGYLLKDWTAIQGRDLTPNPKNKETTERLKILENIYEDLEEFFGPGKRLDWTSVGDQKDDEEILINKRASTSNEEQQKEVTLPNVKIVLNSCEIGQNTENVELNKMVELIEDLQRNEESTNESSELTSLSASTCDKKTILQLLPTTNSLDRMQVSSCSINSQATINTIQKNRSKSPDIFADSDAEMEEIDKAEVVNVAEDKSTNSCLDRMGADVITYEIYSSDEVKNTPLLEVEKTAVKELSPNISSVIDLTQDDLEPSTNSISSGNFDRSKLIEDIDLFAESPLPEDADSIKSHSQHSICIQYNEEKAFKFTLSMEPSDKERQIVEKEMQKTQEHLETFTLQQKDDETVLRGIDMDQSNSSFLNFQGSKQLKTSFHIKTASSENDIIQDHLTGDDTIFQELCNKYLNLQPANDLQNTDFRKSLTQISPKTKTPQKFDSFTNFTLDLEKSFDKIVSLKRKSISFTAKSPLKLERKYSNAFLSKSQTINNQHSNVSIDLTQNDNVDDDNDNGELEDEDDDDCLMLSDDEINYSIWEADKTLHFQTSMPSKHKHNIISGSGNEAAVSDEENTEKILEFPHENDGNQQFSYFELKDKETSLIKIALGPEESISDFGILTSKYATSISPTADEQKFDRSEFGILEEYSAPIDYTSSLCTPTKVLSEASFLKSPTETTAPMKRYSNCQKSSQKFRDLMNDIEAKSPPHAIDDFNDFDEFDRLVSTSSLKSLTSNKKPHGIEQLLTAEISFKESQKLPAASKKDPLDFLEENVEEIKCNNKIYTVRYTSSPKPDYTTYTESELLKELYNFGIKPLKRKQAVKMLEYIYNQTHPILMEEEAESVEEQQDFITLDEFERPSTSKEALKAKALISEFPEQEFAIDLLDVPSNKMNLQDSCGLEMLRYSIDLKAELSDENYILQTNVTKKTAQPLLPFHIAWYNLVCSNRKLHEMILMYEPIDLQEVYLFLKSLGYRYDPKDLKTFFDRRCIIFRYDLASATDKIGQMKNTNRYVRKSKKTTITKNQLLC